MKLPVLDKTLKTTVHRVEPVRRGDRSAAVFWIQSMVRSDVSRRALLYELDRATSATRLRLGDEDSAAVSLVGVYHNLIRMWAEV